MIERLVRVLLRLRLHQLERRIAMSRFDAVLSVEIDRVRAALEVLR